MNPESTPQKIPKVQKIDEPEPIKVAKDQRERGIRISKKFSKLLGCGMYIMDTYLRRTSRKYRE